MKNKLIKARDKVQPWLWNSYKISSCHLCYSISPVFFWIAQKNLTGSIKINKYYTYAWFMYKIILIRNKERVKAQHS